MEAIAIQANGSHPLVLSLARRVQIIFLSVTGVLPDEFELIWWRLREKVLLPAMRVAVIVCLIMSVMLLIEKVTMGLVSLYVKVFNRKPEKVYKWEPIKEDVELGKLAYPMILIQVPMFNEKEVYKHSIGAVCSLVWPSDRLIVQVLDDSTDLSTRDLVQAECERWVRKGINVHYISRDNRNGYKAGAMKEAMEIDYVQQCDYVSIFDADFQPAPDFLMRTVPFLMHNPELALVQSRWKFALDLPVQIQVMITG